MNIIEKYAILEKAFKTLEEAIALYDKFIHRSKTIPCSEIFDTEQGLLYSLQDSLIIRFKYCTDLLWKYVKEFMETREKRLITTPSPRGIFREACLIRIISETETEQCIAMVTDRNKTSHIYYREIADFIAKHIPAHYRLMSSILARLKPE